VVGMMRAYPLIVLLMLALGVPAASAQTNADPGTIDIMRPEQPSPAPKHKTRRGSSSMVYPTPLPKPQGFNPPPSQQLVTPGPPALPPPIVVPETGRVLPNLPSIGSGPGGAETSQDRAARCAHQASVYGDAAGNRNAYVGGCINQ
jgi:hypothetical protein